MLLIPVDAADTAAGAGAPNAVIRTVDFEDAGLYDNFSCHSGDTGGDNPKLYKASMTDWTVNESDNGALKFTTSHTAWPTVGTAVGMQYFDLFDGQDLVLKEGISYVFSMKYKETSADEGKGARISFGYRTSTSGWTNTTAIQYWSTTGSCDWNTVYYQFTATSAMNGKNLALAFNVVSGNTATFYVDYVTLSDTYICDFEDPELFDNWLSKTNNVSTAIYSSSAADWKVENGELKFIAANTNAISNAWLQRISLYNGSYFKMNAGQNYRVTIRYKYSGSESGTGTMGLASTSKVGAVGSYSTMNVIKSYDVNGSGDWQTVTLSFTAAASEYLALVFRVSSESYPYTFNVDCVTVESDCLIVNNCGVVEKVYGYTVGENIPEPEHDPDMQFLGWYSDSGFTTEFGKVKENETRLAYARYNITYLTCTNLPYVDMRDGDSAAVVADYGNKKNSVLAFTMPDHYSWFSVRSYDDANAGKLELIPNADHTVSLKFKAPDSASHKYEIRLYTGTDQNSKEVRNDTSKTFAKGSIANDTWATYSYTFNTNDLAKGNNLMISLAIDDANTQGTVYIDDIKVVGAYVPDEPENGITINNCGIISKTDVFTVGEVLPEPNHSSDMRFFGWYSDPNFENLYGVVRENETRVAYARYDTAYLTCSNAATVSMRDGDTAAIITDPDNIANKVLAFTMPDHYSWFTVRNYDDENASELLLNPNEKYTVSFKFKVADSADHSIEARLYTGTDQASKYVRNDTSITFAKGSIANSTWATYSKTFTTDNLSYGKYLMISFGFDKLTTETDTIYIDDIKITGTNFYTNVTESIHGETSVVSAAVGEELPALPDGEHEKFLAWYSNPECTVPFGNVNMNEPRTAYAKFETKIEVTEMIDGKPVSVWIVVGETLPELAEEKDRTFAGWYSDELCTVPFGAVLENETRTAYASFKMKEKVIENVNGEISTKYFAAGDTLPKGQSTPEMDFLGWYSDPECTVDFGTVKSGETRTAYAKYNKKVIKFETAVINETFAKTVADPGNTDNRALKFTGAGFVNIPLYDAKDVGGMPITAWATYTLRFRYKVVSGSGSITANGNGVEKDEFQSSLQKFSSSGDKSWQAGAVCFTADGNATLMLGVIGTKCEVYIDDLKLSAVDTFVEKSVFAADSSLSSVSSLVTCDDLTVGESGFETVLSIIPAAGEQVAGDAINISYDLYGTAFSSKVERKVFNDINGYDVSGEAGKSDGLKYNVSVPAGAVNVKISVGFTDADNTNVSIIAASYREKTDSASTGLRFRGRVFKQSAANILENGRIDNVGFLISPEYLVKKAGYTTLTLENLDACDGLSALMNGCIYDSTDLYDDYQVILVGDNMENLKNVDMMVVTYVVYENGSVEYSKPYVMSYNTVYERVNITVRGVTDFYAEEFKDTRDKLIASESNDGFSFLHISDTHTDYSDVADGVYRSLKAMVELANTSDVECIALGGDIIHGCNGKETSIKYVENIKSILSEASVPVLISIGNHDSNPYHSTGNSGADCPASYIITCEDWAELFIDPMGGDRVVHDSKNYQSSYYYMDFAGSKTRMISLNAFDFPMIVTPEGYTTWVSETWDRISDRQMQWFAEEALNVPAGWAVQIIIHPDIHKGNGEGGRFKNADVTEAIITAFNNKTAYTNEAYGIDVDYADSKSFITLITYGHTHIDAYYTDVNAKVVYVNTGHGKYSPAYNINGSNMTSLDAWDDPDREKGTVTEALFNAISCRTNGTVSVYRFGAGKDYELNAFERVTVGEETVIVINPDWFK